MLKALEILIKFESRFSAGTFLEASHKKCHFNAGPLSMIGFKFVNRDLWAKEL